MGFTLLFKVERLVEMVHGSWIMAQKPIAADWGSIKSLFLSGVTLVELSERFQIKLGTLQSRSSREGWAVPPERLKASMAVPTEKTTAILHDLWAERAAFIREKEFKISEKVLSHAEQMPEDELLKKADGLDKLAKMGRRATGLDSEDKEKASVNIAVLGDISAMPSESTLYTKIEPSALGEPKSQEAVTDSVSTE